MYKRQYAGSITKNAVETKKKARKKTLALKGIPEPFPNGSQTLPSHCFVFVGHQSHDPGLQTQFFHLVAPFRQHFHQLTHVIAPNRQHLLVIVPFLGEDLCQFLGISPVALVQNPTCVLFPKRRVSVRWRPAEVARLQLSRVLIEGGLCLCVFIQHIRQRP